MADFNNRPGTSAINGPHLPYANNPQLSSGIGSTQFVITAILFPKIDPKTRAWVFTFIRRTLIAYDTYHSAKVAYAIFFHEQDHHAFLRALRDFEMCLAAAYQGHEILFALRNAGFRDKDAVG
jgi:hypothetical protein